MGLLDLASKGELVKAVLEVVLGEGDPPGDRKIRFIFNPENCSVKGGANWNLDPSKAAEHSPPPHYGGAHHVTLSMNVLFDESEKASGDVSKYVETLLTWTRPTPDTLKSKKKGIGPAGPILQFTWGSNKQFQRFRCVLSSVNAQYTMFRRDGTPIRAMVSITLEQVPPEFKRQNPTSGAIHGRSAHVVADGDSLPSIAFQEYGDPGLWRGLAAFNGVDDPLRVHAGTSVLIPTPAEAQRVASGGS